MNHSDMPDELYELYLLGLLDANEREAVEAHVREGCPECAAKLAEASRLTIAMAGIADQVRPPANLRNRVLSTVTPTAQHSRWIWTTSSLAAACVVMFALLIWLGGQNSKLRQQADVLRSERNELAAALQFMSQPETRAVQFGSIRNAPHGRVFMSRNGGVVFVGSGLPALPMNRTFELWVVPAKGAPVPAGTFRPTVAGTSVDMAPPNVSASGAAAVAVSVEPPQGSSAPTTKPFLVVPLA